MVASTQANATPIRWTPVDKRNMSAALAVITKWLEGEANEYAKLGEEKSVVQELDQFSAGVIRRLIAIMKGSAP